MTTEAATEQDVVLKVDDLRTYFTTRWGTVKAVDGISFDLRRGETLGIVGESGSGKSVTMLSLMRLIPMPPGRIVSGSINLDGEDLLQLSESEMNRVRGSKIALIIQDPMTSLNPVFTIGNQVSEAIKIHQDIPKRSVMEQALSVLRKVNIPAAEFADARLSPPDERRNATARGGRHRHLLPTPGAHRRPSRPPRWTSPSRPSTWPC